MKTEKIHLKPDENYIRLDHVLKLSGAVPTGGSAKIEIQGGNVKVNGEICTQRGKKLHKGDTAEFDGTVFEVC